MRNAIIGIVIGIVVGVVVGATVVAPRLTPEADKKAAGLQPKAQKTLPLVKEIQPAAGTALERDKRDPADTKQVDAPEASSPPKTAAETGAKPEAKLEAKDEAKASSSEKQDSPEQPTSPPPPFAMTEVSAVKAPLIIPPHDHPPAPPPPEPTARHWKMASAYASTLPQLGTLAKKLDRDIWRVSNGMLEIKFFEPGALVPPLEMFDAVRAGVIDAAFSSPGFWSNKIPALQLFAAIPFGPSAKELLAWIYFGGGQELFNAIYRANGIHSIFCGLIAPEAAGWFRNRIRTVEDLKGLKMRFFGLGAKVVTKLGVVTSQLTSGDIFVAFDNGEIDAAERLSPHDPFTWLFDVNRAVGNLVKADYEAALRYAEKASRRGAKAGFWPDTLAAAALAQLGRHDEAARALAAARARQPRLSIAFVKRSMPFRFQDHFDNQIDGLRKAGLEDEEAPAGD